MQIDPVVHKQEQATIAPSGKFCFHAYLEWLTILADLGDQREIKELLNESPIQR